MTKQQAFQRITQETIEEHRQINFYLDQITLTLDALDVASADVEPMRRLAAQIEGLKERLVEHHLSEEKDGLFQAVLEAMPDCRVEISRLTKQHQRIIEILEMARIHAQHGEPSETESLREDLRNFLEMFRRHEYDEESLLKRALERENRAAID
ncbi:MAG TPA: hemerythrin domain-containing protein [Candidatus Polarisedimenticolaceae bacterium]|nr:hemerythrin domain-containing protein [Candidatus Polarisedimenticolaceae bacterium]